MKIYYLLLDDAIEYRQLEKYITLLPPERREKIIGLRFDGDKLLSLTAGLMLRRFLSPDCLIRYNDFGKPYSANTEQFFSLSHSARAVALAIDDSEVGVDIERRREKDIEKLARRFFARGELSAFLDAEDRAATFTEIWTRKESYIKFTGVGLSTDLLSFDTSSEPLSEQIISVPVGEYYLSVCSDRPLQTVDISKLELKELIKE